MTSKDTEDNDKVTEQLPTTPRSRPKRIKAQSSLAGMFDEYSGGGNGTPTTPCSRRKATRECLPRRLQHEDCIQTSQSADSGFLRFAEETAEPSSTRYLGPTTTKDNNTSVESSLADMSLHDLVRSMRRTKRQVIDTVRSETGGGATLVNYREFITKTEQETKVHQESDLPTSPPLTLTQNLREHD